MFSRGRSVIRCHSFRRYYKVLAIETSCDDTCVALIDRTETDAKLLEHVKITLDSIQDGGIVPTKAFDHHQMNISKATKQIFKKHNLNSNNPPDLICVTRGPGMKGSLTIGLDFAKGLATAFDKPFIGVHHMLGHLLVPRFANVGKSPSFPFLNLLISGGHTMLVLSNSLLDHEILCDTIDVAAGDALDKCSREIGLKGNNLGREMENFIKNGEVDWNFKKFEMPKPLSNKRDRVDQVAFSFGPFQGTIRRLIESSKYDLNNLQEQRSLAYQVQNAIFDHIISKLELTMTKHKDKLVNVKDFVASGGVASNTELRNRLNECFKNTNITTTTYPELSLCTDNAVMIGWAGIELYEKEKLTTDLSVCPISKWPLSDITNVPGWIKS